MNKKTVPAFVPNFEDANMIGRWDGSPRSEMWSAVQDMRELTIIESAAALLSVGGEDTDLPGLLQFLWGGLDTEEYENLVEKNLGYIESRAEGLRAANATTD